MSGGVGGAGNGVALDRSDGIADVGWVTSDWIDSTAFVEKRDQPTGAVRWSHSSPHADAEAVAVGPLGNVAVGGAFWGATNFGGAPIAAQSSTGYLASYEGATGNLLWQRALPGVLAVGRGTIAPDPLGDVIVVGSFARSADLGLGAPIPSLGPEDVFVAKYSGLTGLPLWVRTFTSPDGAAATGVATAPNGDPVVVGQFGYSGGSIMFGLGTPLEPPAEQGRFAGFVVRLEGHTGQPLWSRGFAGGGTTGVFDPQVAVDCNGDAIVAGQGGAGEDFGGGRVPNDMTTNSGFVAKYAGVDGAYRWSWTVFSAGAYESVATVGSDAVGDPVIGGKLNSIVMKSAAGEEFDGPSPGHVTTARLSGITGRPQAVFTNLDGSVSGVAIDQPGHLFTASADTSPVVTG